MHNTPRATRQEQRFQARARQRSYSVCDTVLHTLTTLGAWGPGRVEAHAARRLFAEHSVSIATTRRRPGGRMRLLATIEDPRRILAHLGLPTEGPDPCPSRPPPVHTADIFVDIPAPA